MHEEGFDVERLPDGTLRFRGPHGHVIPNVPPPAAVPRDPVWVLRERNAADGLSIHPRTAMPLWMGERLNVGYAIDVLHPPVRSGPPESF